MGLLGQRCSQDTTPHSLGCVIRSGGLCACRETPPWGHCPPVLAPDPSCPRGDPPDRHGGIQPPDPLGQVPQAATRAASRSCFPAPRCPQTPLCCRAAVVPCAAGSLPWPGAHGGCSGPSLPPSPSASSPCSLLCHCLFLSPLPLPILSLSSLPVSLSRSLCWRRFSQLCSAHCQDVPAEPSVLALPAQPGPVVPIAREGLGGVTEPGGGYRGSQVGWGRL